MGRAGQAKGFAFQNLHPTYHVWQTSGSKDPLLALEQVQVMLAMHMVGHKVMPDGPAAALKAMDAALQPTSTPPTSTPPTHACHSLARHPLAPPTSTPVQLALFPCRNHKGLAPECRSMPPYCWRCSWTKSITDDLELKHAESTPHRLVKLHTSC